MNKLILFIITVLLLINLGCGTEAFKNYVPPVPESEIEGNGRPRGLIFNGLGTQEDPNYICPKSPNLTPDYDKTLDGSGYYTVCKNKLNTSDTLLHGKTYLASAICLFPAEWISQENIYTKPDLITQAPWSQCFEIEQKGVYASFQGINYNAFYLVEKPFHEDMQNCLLGGRLALCPPYSFGRFR